jgi:hypothetical protein
MNAKELEEKLKDFLSGEISDDVLGQLKLIKIDITCKPVNNQNNIKIDYDINIKEKKYRKLVYDIEGFRYNAALGFVHDKINEIQNVSSILTNGNIASVLQDLSGYKIYPTNPDVIEPGLKRYNLGQIDNIEIWVDPYMRWDNNIIYLEDQNEKSFAEIEIIDKKGILL